LVTAREMAICSVAILGRLAAGCVHDAPDDTGAELIDDAEPDTEDTDGSSGVSTDVAEMDTYNGVDDHLKVRSSDHRLMPD
jgi:hypothetical protein